MTNGKSFERPKKMSPLFEADKRAQHPIGIGWRLNLD